MTSVLEALVLDVDDTLYLERDYVRSGFDHIETWCAVELGTTGVGTVAWSLFLDGVRRTTLTDALVARGVTPAADLVEKIVLEYRSHRPSIRLLPDALELLEHWSGRVPISVVTDGPAVSQRAKCEALGLDRWATRIVVTAEHGSSKPDPEMFRLAVSGGPASGNVAYVADNPTKDFAGPLGLGWRGVRVRRKGALHEAKQSPPGVIEVDDLRTRGLLDALR